MAGEEEEGSTPLLLKLPKASEEQEEDVNRSGDMTSLVSPFSSFLPSLPFNCCSEIGFLRKGLRSPVAIMLCSLPIYSSIPLFESFHFSWVALSTSPFDSTASNTGILNCMVDCCFISLCL